MLTTPDRPPESSSISPTPYPYMVITIKDPTTKGIVASNFSVSRLINHREHEEGSSVQFYPIITQTNHKGFASDSNVNRRYSDFQRFRRLLVDKGLHPPPLRWTRKIPSFNGSSQREEIQIFLDYVAKEDSLLRCPKEIQFFLQSSSDPLYKTRRASILSTILVLRRNRNALSPIPSILMEQKLYKMNQHSLRA
ncbi:hypothetical protein Clacol_004605 [Clathrus columnatus]|uniref:PX domain-containing protein n=1 Tax=Clathrus columnatus TaxID=1419009 RepID=A0AAV5A6X3_9AGAM|nr:hypothetical protein Clacol_004605 [Clathrus columnatus]